MKIDKISKNKSGKYKVIFDNNESLTTYDDVILNHGLLFKKDLSSEEINDINIESKYYDFYNKTVKFISVKMRSLKEIVNFLDKNGVEEADKQKIIAKLKEIKLIDDKRYANAYLQDRLILSSDGPHKIKQGLKNNDITDEIIDEVFAQVDNTQVYDKLVKLIQKRIKINHNKSNFMLKQKIMNDMINLGYEKEMIAEILENKIESNNRVINSEYNKLKTKLSQKYSGNELEEQVKIKLRQKGFSLDEINSIEKED